MRRGRITSSCRIILLALVVHAAAPVVSGDTLYGIIDEGAHAGYLITIDMSTGEAELVGDTGLDRPCVLAFDSSKDILLTSDYGEYPTQGYAVDQQTGETSTIIEHLTPNLELAYHPAEDVLYTIEPGYNESSLIKLDPDDGTMIEAPAPSTKGQSPHWPFEPLSDALYGIGLLDGRPWLFRVPSVQGSITPPDLGVAEIDRILTGIAFATQGRLYGTDGERLYRVDTLNGSLDEIGPHGDLVGFVNDVVLVPTNSFSCLVNSVVGAKNTYRVNTLSRSSNGWRYALRGTRNVHFPVCRSTRQQAMCHGTHRT